MKKNTKRIEEPQEKWICDRRVVAYIVEWNDDDYKLHMERFRNLPSRTTAVESIDGRGNRTRYASIKEASKATGICKSSISRTINNQQLTAGGYRWKKLKE